MWSWNLGLGLDSSLTLTRLKLTSMENSVAVLERCEDLDGGLVLFTLFSHCWQ